MGPVVGCSFGGHAEWITRTAHRKTGAISKQLFAKQKRCEQPESDSDSGCVVGLFMLNLNALSHESTRHGVGFLYQFCRTDM